jgi:hypothetical protein
MRHASMAAAAEESNLAQEVFLPIPADPLRPRHVVVVVGSDAVKMKFDAMYRAAGFAAPAEGRDKLGAED